MPALAADLVKSNVEVIVVVSSPSVLAAKQAIFHGPGRPVAVLWNPDYTGMRARYLEAEGAAPRVGFALRSVEVRDSRELEQSLGALDRERPDALLLLADPLTLSQRMRIVEYAAEQRLPAMYEVSQFVGAGGLHLVRARHQRAAAQVGDLRRQDPEGREAGGSSDRAARTVRSRDQPASRQGAGHRQPQAILLQADKVIE